MTDDAQNHEYIKQLQEQVLAILNGVKQEIGVDTPVEIEVRELSEDE